MCKVSSTAHFVSHSVARIREGTRGHWVPNTDIYATDSGLVVKVELAGMRNEDLEITVEGNRLRIAGTRPDGCRSPKCNFLVMEINYGPFESLLEVPPGYDLSQAKAAYQNGFLRIDVPMTPRPSKNTKVPVTEGNSK